MVFKKYNLRGVRADELMKLVGAREHDNRNPSVTQNRELVGFLEQPISSL